MAVIWWVGNARIVPQVTSRVVSSVSASNTITVTVGNSKVITYTCISGDTAITAVANLLALLNASQDGEFCEIAWELGSTTATIQGTGPTTGAPCTITIGGTATFSGASTTTGPSSPNDFNNSANFSTGSTPANGDTVIFANNGVNCSFNLQTITTTFNIEIRDTYTGTIGLPTINPGQSSGVTNTNVAFNEWRPLQLQVNGTSMIAKIPQGSTVAGRFRINNGAGSAATLTMAQGLAQPSSSTSVTGTSALVTGITATSGASTQSTNPNNLGSEIFWLEALPAFNNILDIGGGCSIAVCPLPNQTGQISLISANNATVRIGSGVALTTMNVSDSTVRMGCTYTTLNAVYGSSVTITGSASGTTTKFGAGTPTGGKSNPSTLSWLSTGGPGTFSLNSGCTVDFSNAPAAISGVTITAQAGSTINDPGDLLTGLVLVTSGCALGDLTIISGLSHTWTKS